MTALLCRRIFMKVCPEMEDYQVLCIHRDTFIIVRFVLEYLDSAYITYFSHKILQYKCKMLDFLLTDCAATSIIDEHFSEVVICVFRDVVVTSLEYFGNFTR